MIRRLRLFDRNRVVQGASIMVLSRTVILDQRARHTWFTRAVFGVFVESSSAAIPPCAYVYTFDTPWLSSIPRSTAPQRPSLPTCMREPGLSDLRNDHPVQTFVDIISCFNHLHTCNGKFPQIGGGHLNILSATNSLMAQSPRPP